MPKTKQLSAAEQRKKIRKLTNNIARAVKEIKYCIVHKTELDRDLNTALNKADMGQFAVSLISIKIVLIAMTVHARTIVQAESDVRRLQRVLTGN